MIREVSKILPLVAVSVMLSSGIASAQEKEAFTEERFAELQEEGALILVDVFADWCPVCAQQQEILSDFREEHPDVPLHVLQVDFDKQKKYVRQFEAPRQSTFILYRGEERVWFSVAETSREVIFNELTKAAVAADSAG